MKGYRFYAEMEDARSSKSASKRWPAFTVSHLRKMAAGGWHVNVIAVLLGEKGQPLWTPGTNCMAAICPMNGCSNAPVQSGSPSIDYLRARCVRIDAELARKLHPNLFSYLEN